MNSASPSALIAFLFATVLLAGCSRPQPATTASTATPPAPATSTVAPAQVASTDIYRFKIGSLDAVALKDGDIEVPNDNETFGVGQPVADSTALLAAAHAPTDVLHLSIQPLLVRSGDRVLLFDTGAAGAPFAKAGRLPASLHAAGFAPAQVTDIFISHGHQDHVGGLVDAHGALAFANATIHVSAAEWKSLQDDKDAAALVAAITPKVRTFQPGAVLVPGVVTAVDFPGHTPGHSGYDIASATNTCCTSATRCTIPCCRCSGPTGPWRGMPTPTRPRRHAARCCNAPRRSTCTCMPATSRSRAWGRPRCRATASCGCPQTNRCATRLHPEAALVRGSLRPPRRHDRVTEATAKKRSDGRYDVTLKLHAAKRYADGKGKETAGRLDGWMDVGGVFARGPSGKEADENVLHLQRHRITSEDPTITVVVDQLPYEAGLDPYNKLIDRVSDDNRKRVMLQ